MKHLLINKHPKPNQAQHTQAVMSGPVHQFTCPGQVGHVTLALGSVVLFCQRMSRDRIQVDIEGKVSKNCVTCLGHTVW